jgi:NAD(P)-dependent dehydrogenase (short-subunit alcohol dehydrogenase family)
MQRFGRLDVLVNNAGGSRRPRRDRLPRFSEAILKLNLIALSSRSRRTRSCRTSRRAG